MEDYSKGELVKAGVERKFAIIGETLVRDGLPASLSRPAGLRFGEPAGCYALSPANTREAGTGKTFASTLHLHPPLLQCRNLPVQSPPAQRVAAHIEGGALGQNRLLHQGRNIHQEIVGQIQRAQPF